MIFLIFGGFRAVGFGSVSGLVVEYVSRSANTSRDRSADNTTNNNVKIEEEASVTTTSI